MKKVIIALFLITIYLCNGNFIAAEEKQADAEITMSSGFNDCLRDVNVEEEVKRYLGDEPVYVNLKECLEIALLYPTKAAG